jgi:hypothetical protein
MLATQDTRPFVGEVRKSVQNGALSACSIVNAAVCAIAVKDSGRIAAASMTGNQ